MRISWTPGPTLGIGFQSFGSRPHRTRQSWNPAICRAASGKWPTIQELGCCVDARRPPHFGMADIRKRVKRLLRECAATRPSRPKEISMANRYQDIGVARQIGSYSDAVEVPPNARWLVTAGTDRKSTRLNSSHLVISYAVFCLKKKKLTYDASI